MLTLLQIYFWSMLVYLVASVVGKLLKLRAIATARLPASFWAEEVAGYVLLSIGLLGVHGYITSTPLLTSAFWKTFVLALALFAASQVFMPKMRLLRKQRGTGVAVAAAAIGVLLLVPMFVAVGQYAFHSFAT